jgi:hypothetical protein
MKKYLLTLLGCYLITPIAAGHVILPIAVVLTVIPFQITGSDFELSFAFILLLAYISVFMFRFAFFPASSKNSFFQFRHVLCYTFHG